jgi:hypothetical protein
MKNYIKPSLILVVLIVLAAFVFVGAQQNQNNFNPGTGTGSGTVSVNNGTAGAIANYAAAGGSTTVGPDANLVDASNTLTYLGSGGFTAGANGGAAGVLNLKGSTSGAVICTAPAVAGTSTNALTCTNVLLLPAGAVSTPGYGFTGDTNTGMWDSGPGNLMFSVQGTGLMEIAGGGATAFRGNQPIGFAAAGLPAALDTGISRDAAAVVDFGSGAAANTTARLKAAGYMSVGTTFTSNAGCGDTTLVGGATAGKYTSVTAGTCTTVITMGNSATAPNGWSCTATDLTTAADAGNIKQTATTTTSASLNETTVVASDVIQFSCIGY